MSRSEVTNRLTILFATVLEIPASEVGPELSPQTCPTWDSLNHIHLVTAVEEEFGLELDFEDQMRMTSFAVAEEIVTTACGA